MSVALRKIAGDLRNSRSQAWLLFAAILVGQAIMTAAFMARSVIATEIDRNYALTMSPDITVDAAGADVRDLRAIERISGVAAVDAVATISGRYRLPDGKWRQIILYGRRDFSDQRVSRIFSKTGPWPPSNSQVLLEQSGTGIAQKKPGEAIDVSFGRGKSLRLTYAGTVHDAAQAPSWQESTIYGYTRLDALVTAAGPRTIQYRILLTAEGAPATVAKDVSAALVAQGGRILRVNTVAAAHPHADLMNGLLILLSIFSVLSFIVAICLAASILAGLAQRQEKPVAVLRALGASRRKIGFMHFAFALTPALPGLLLGAWAGQFGARLLEAGIANQLNIELSGSAEPTSIRNTLLIVGFLGVLLSLVIPIAASLRKTVREVLQSGLKQLRSSRVRLRLFSPMDRLAIAENLQRPVKTAITVAALTLAGAALLSSSNAFASLVSLVDRMSESRRDNIEVVLSDPANPEKLQQAIKGIDGLRSYELWDRVVANLSAGGASAGRVALLNPPISTRMGLPNVVAGRWPTGDGEIAVSQMAAAMNPPLKTAFDKATHVDVAADGRAIKVRVVGLTDEWGASAWTSAASFVRLAQPADRARLLRAIADPERVASAQPQIEQAVMASGSFPLSSSTSDGRREVMVNHFYSFYQFLLIAGLGGVVIGGIALSASIGSSVLARVREIGVLKALGAGSADLFRLVLVQALTITIASVVLAVIISLPLSSLMTRLLEDYGLHMHLPLKISWAAMAAMAAGAVVLGVLAAIAPAIRIKGMPIREAITAE